jgi:hypothetical protein
MVPSTQLLQLHTSRPQVVDMRNEMPNTESLVVDHSGCCVCKILRSVHVKDPLWNFRQRMRCLKKNVIASTQLTIFLQWQSKVIATVISFLPHCCIVYTVKLELRNYLWDTERLAL